MMEMVKSGVAPDEAAKRVFDIDRDAMERSDVIVAVLDGANIDEGVAFEIGFMFGIGKYCIGLQTDMRRVLPTGNNPMIGSALRAICNTTEMLVSVLAGLVEGKMGSRISDGTIPRFAKSRPRTFGAG